MLRCSNNESFSYSYGHFLRGNGDIEQELVSQGATVACFGAESSTGILAKLPALVSHLRRARPDLIHAHLPLAGVMGRLASRMLGIPLVYTEHSQVEYYHVGTRIASRLTWHWQKRVVAVSEDVARSIRRNLGNRVGVQVIRNGIDVEHFGPQNTGEAVRRRLGIGQGDVLIGTVAGFREAKRLDVWVEIASRLLQRHSGITFIIVGSGPLENVVKRQAADLGVVGKVKFVGSWSDVRPFLASFDIFLITSSIEGLPIALLEAMAMGCVAISTAAGGIREVIEHNQNGLLVDVNSPEMLVGQVESVLYDSAERARLSENARRTIGERFSIQRMLSEIEQLYCSCLDGSNLS